MGWMMGSQEQDSDTDTDVWIWDQSGSHIDKNMRNYMENPNGGTSHDQAFITKSYKTVLKAALVQTHYFLCEPSASNPVC